MSSTLRYRAHGNISYAHALVALVEYARASGEPLDFGPLDLKCLAEQGLAVSGPDLEMVSRVLERVPGLYRSDE